MREYVNRRVPLLWKLIMPLNQRGVTLDSMLLGKIKAERSQKIKTWKKRAEQHFKESEIGTYDSKLKTRLPIGQKGGFSWQKMQKLLYEELGLPKKYTPEGAVTVNRKALERLVKLDRTNTVEVLLERSQLKDIETPLKSLKADADGRQRTRFIMGGDEKWEENEVGVESPGSGRLASRGPNLQNLVDWLRCVFVPRHPDRWLLKADYSQIEMRLIAYLSGDPELQKAVDSDAHLYIMYLIDQTADLYGLHQRGFARLLKDYRRGDPEVVFARDETKRTDYGWGYRMGAKKLETVRGVPYDTGKRALAALNQRFHYVVDWWDSLVREVSHTALGSNYGHLTNEYGRIRHFFLDDVPAVCNFKPQSLAADILYDAMEELEARLSEELDSEMVLTVHDEVVIDTPDPVACMKLAREVMERPKPELDGLSIPVDFLVGKNWAKYHKHSKVCGKGCRKRENLKGQREWKQWKKAA
jgi:DNA polymerase-1